MLRKRIEVLRAGATRHRHARRLRKGVREILLEAGVTEPVDMFSVCEAVSGIWPVPIVCAPFSFPAAGPFGLTVRYEPELEPGDAAIYILYQDTTTELHQQHILAHEFGHVACGHRLQAVTRVEDIDAHGSGALRRTNYTTQIEQDAEQVATMLLARIAASDGVAMPTESVRARAAQWSLGDRITWL